MEDLVRRVHAVTINRSHLLGRLAAAAIVCAISLALSAPARADVTIGQLPDSAPTPTCTGGFDYLQPSVTGGSLYTAREAGQITQWSTYSSIGGASYTFKIFRRTSDPDVFQVISHGQPQTLPSGSGVETFGTALHVDSGDMIGFNESGPPNSCTFPMPGDSVLRASGNVADGEMSTFSPQDDVRLNLSATLVPTNTLTFAGVARNKKFGTAILTVEVSNPGTAAMTGKGLKKRRATKSAAMAGPLTFAIAPSAPTLRRLNRNGSALVHVTVTFTPPGGDPHGESLAVRLKKRKSAKTIP